jgi:hypothetical protein
MRKAMRKYQSDYLSVNELSERAARRKLIEELFYDFYKSRHRVYWMNFVRGLFLGFGTIIGGTVVVAAMIWLLGQMASWFPGIGAYIRQIIDTIQRA